MLDQREQVLPRMLGVVESDHHPVVEDEGGHAGRPDSRRPRMRGKRIARLRVLVDRVQDDAQDRPFVRQLRKKRLGVGAMRAALAYIHLAHCRPSGVRRGRCRLARCRMHTGPRRQRAQQQESTGCPHAYPPTHRQHRGQSGASMAQID